MLRWDPCMTLLMVGQRLWFYNAEVVLDSGLVTIFSWWLVIELATTWRAHLTLGTDHGGNLRFLITFSMRDSFIKTVSKNWREAAILHQNASQSLLQP